jgi:hypothetical protein
MACPNKKLSLTYSKALEFSERLFLETITPMMPRSRQSLLMRDWAFNQMLGNHQVQLTTVLMASCELGAEEIKLVDGIHPYYQTAKYRPGEPIFLKNSQSDAFYIVLDGFVAVPEERNGNALRRVLSGAGEVKQLTPYASNSFTEGHIHKVGGVFGYCDYLLERYRSFPAQASGQDGVLVAVFTMVNVDKMKDENNPLYLMASVNDLANCTCHN